MEQLHKLWSFIRKICEEVSCKIVNRAIVISADVYLVESELIYA